MTIYKSEKGKQEILELYDRQLKRLSAPYSDKYVSTSFEAGIIAKTMCANPGKVKRAVLYVPSGIKNAPAIKNMRMMFPIETSQQLERSFFFELTDEQIKDIQTNVAICAREWIFSRNALTEEQVERVKEGRSRWDIKSGKEK